MAEEPLEKIGSILAILLAAILILNELIAWSTCKANTLMQYLFQASCIPIQNENDVATQTNQAPQSV